MSRLDDSRARAHTGDLRISRKLPLELSGPPGLGFQCSVLAVQVWGLGLRFGVDSFVLGGLLSFGPSFSGLGDNDGRF